MITLSRLKRSEIDAWEIMRSGLPLRARNSLAKAGIATIGELRVCSDDRLLRMQAFGTKSLADVKRFFRLSAQLEANEIHYLNLEDFLKRTLSSSVREAIEHRYGLRTTWTDPRGPRTTLQSLGNKRHLTRERIRQLQELGDHELRCMQGQLLLAKIAEHFAARINMHKGVADLATLARWHSPMTGSYTVLGTLWLLKDFNDRIHARHGFFTTASTDQLIRVESSVLDYLRNSDPPVESDRILAALPVEERNLGRAFLAYHPEIGVMKREEYFLMREQAPLLLEHILRDADAPLHYRQITNAYNEITSARSLCRPGQIIRFLRKSSRAERLSLGTYRLRQGT